MSKRRGKVYRPLILLTVFGMTGAQAVPLDPELGIITIPLYSVMSPSSSTQANTARRSNADSVRSTGRTRERQCCDHCSWRGISSTCQQPGRAAGSRLVCRTRHNGVCAQVQAWSAESLSCSAARRAEGEFVLFDRWLRNMDSRRIELEMMGFSAGGHLAAEVATRFNDAAPTGNDPVDQLSSRPDFVILAYPWLNAMEPAQGTEITYCSMLRVLSAAQCAALTEPYTPKLHVTRETPPTFIYSTSDDTVVPVRASTEFYDAMIARGVDAEMHLFRHGAHGLGLGAGDASLDQWPALLESWLRARGLFSPPARTAIGSTKR